MRPILSFLIISILMIGAVNASETHTWHNLDFDNFELDNKTIDKGSGVIKYGIFADDFNYSEGSSGNWAGSPQYRNGYMYPVGGSSYIIATHPATVLPQENFSIFSDIYASGRPYIGFGGAEYTSIVGGGAFVGEYWQLNDGYDSISKLGNVGTGRPTSGTWFNVRLDVTRFNETLNLVTMYGNDNYITYGYTSRNADNWAAKQFGSSNVSARDNFRVYNTDVTTGIITTDIQDSYITGYPTKVKLLHIGTGATFTERIFIKSSSDNFTWSSWREVTSNAISNTSYDIPLINQERYYQLRIEGETSDVHVSNEIIGIEVEQFLDESLIDLEFYSVSPVNSEFPLFTSINQVFSGQVSKTSTFNWSVNGVIDKSDVGVMTSSYTFNENVEGIYNVTLFVSSMGDTISQSWEIDVVQLPQGTISWSDFDKTIYVSNSPSINLKQIYLTLNNPDAIRINGTVYESHGIALTNSYMYIEDIDELKLMGKRLTYGAGYNTFSMSSDSYLKLRNTTISLIDPTTLSYSRNLAEISFHNLDAKDVKFYNTRQIRIFSLYNNHMENIETEEIVGLYFEGIRNSIIKNISMSDSYGGSGGNVLNFDSSCDNLTIDNIYSNTTHTFSSNMGVYGTNITAYNLTLLNAGDYLNIRTPSTGTYNLKASGSNNHFENVYCDYSKWSSISVGGTGATWKNITVLNSGHNGIDAHPGKNQYFEDVTVFGSEALEILLTSGYASSPSIDNITINGYNIGTGGILIDQNVTDVLFMNGRNKGPVTTWTGEFTEKGANFPRFINTTGSSFRFWYYEGRSNHKGAVIDSTYNVIERYLPSDPYHEEMVVFGNVNYTSLQSYSMDNMSIAYYPNIQVLNETNYTVKDAKVTFTSQYGDLIPTWNAYGFEQTEFITDSSGKLINSNRSTTPLLTWRYYNKSSVLYEPVWTATIEKDGQMHIIGNITPEQSWLSTELYTTNAPLMISILDVEGYGEPVESLFITESSPTDTTPTITVGQSQTFSVTLNKPSSITWYVNAVETEIVSGVLTDTFSYGAGQAAGEYNIVATAVNGTDSLIQTWTLTIEAEPVTPEEPSDRMSGPETAIALIGVLLVVLVATAILGSLAGLITGVIDMQQTAAIVGAMVLVAVLAFVGLAVLSGISGALNL